MPRWNAKLDDGRTVVLESDTQPTADEVLSAVAEYKPPDFSAPTGTETRLEPGRAYVNQAGTQSTTYGGPPKPVASFGETMVEPAEEMLNPRFTTPKLTVNPDDHPAVAIGKTAVNIASSIPEFFSSNLGVVSMAAGAAAPVAVAGAFTVDMLKSAGEQIHALYKDWDQMTKAQHYAALTEIGGTGLMAMMAGTHATRGVLDKVVPARAVAKMIKESEFTPTPKSDTALVEPGSRAVAPPMVTDQDLLTRTAPLTSEAVKAVAEVAPKAPEAVPPPAPVEPKAPEPVAPAKQSEVAPVPPEAKAESTSMQEARRQWIDEERKTNPKFAPDTDSWKELLSPKELEEVKEWEDLRYKAVARQGPETGYKAYKLTAKQKARLQELNQKYIPRQQAEITDTWVSDPTAPPESAPTAVTPAAEPGVSPVAAETKVQPSRLNVRFGESNRQYNKQKNAFKDAGIELRDAGAYTLGSKARMGIVPDTPEARALLKKMGMTVAREQWDKSKKSPTTAAPAPVAEGKPAPVAKTGSQPIEDVTEPASSFRHIDANDEYLYHVTTRPNADTILKEGFSTGKKQTVQGGAYQNYSRGKLFFTDKAGVSSWIEKIQLHLEHAYDNVPEIAVLRVRKDSFAKNSLKPDEIGTRDVNAPSWYIEKGESISTPSKPAPAPVAEGKPAPVAKEGEKGPVGMGGAVPGEYQPSGQTQTSIKNAVVDAERLQRGEPPMMDVIRRGREEVWQKAMGILDRDPMAREKLVAELTEKPRAINDYEVALLDHLRVDLKNEYAKATREAAQAADDGRLHDLDRLNEVTNMWSDKLLQLERAAGKGGAGTETARGLAYRRQMVNDDFTLANLELEARKASGYRQLTTDERAELKKQADEYKTKADAYEKRVATLEAERDAKEIEHALALAEREAKSEYSPEVIRIAENIVASWDRRADAARLRIKEKLARMSAGVDPTLILDLAEVGLSHIGHVALDAVKFGEKMRSEFGDKINPFLDAVWKKTQELLAKEKSKATPNTPHAKAVDKITKPSAPASDITAKIKERVEKNGTGDISWHVRKLARAIVSEGVKDLNTLIDRVHEVLSEVIPGITRRETMDAITGYGKFTPLKKDAVSIILRDLVGQGQQIAKLEDMAAGEAPKKTGFQRREPSDTERELLKKVNEAKKVGGYEVTDPEAQLRSAMQAVHTRLENQIKDLETQILRREKIVKEPSRLIYDEKANQLKARRDELMEQFKAIFPKTPISEAQRLALWKERVVERTKELQTRLDAGDFSKRATRSPVQLDPEALRLRFDMHTIERQILEGRAAEQRKLESVAKKGIRYAGEIINTFRALKTSFDLSAFLRQGDITVLAHPIRSAKVLPSSIKTFGSAKEHFKTAEEIRSRANAPLAEQSGLYLAEHGGRLSQMEEVYMSRWAEQIPGIRGSGRSYTSTLNLLRMDSFDALASTLGSKGMLTLPQAKVIANWINVSTGRGSKGLDTAATTLNTVFFAPRWVISRLQLLSGQPLWGAGPWKGTGAARKLIALEYGRAIIGAGVVYALANAAGLKIETNPHSGNFLKIRVGNTFLDPLGGLIQWAVFLTRMASGRTVNKQGKDVPIRDRYLMFPYRAKAKVQFGKTEAPDVMTRFVRSKFSPAVGETVNFFVGEDLGYEPMTLISLPRRFLEPMNIADIRKAIVEEGIPTGTALALLSTFGMSMQTQTKKRYQAP